MTNKEIIEVVGGSFALTTYWPEVHKIEAMYQIVAIPWVNSEGEVVQLSVGVTQYGNVVNYAKGIWSKIKKALKKRQLAVVACSSGVNAALHYNIDMYPDGAVPV